jgi:hypothetical protein
MLILQWLIDWDRVIVSPLSVNKMVGVGGATSKRETTILPLGVVSVGSLPVWGLWSALTIVADDNTQRIEKIIVCAAFIVIFLFFDFAAQR